MEALQNQQPAVIDFGISKLYNVTHNRRTGISPYVTYNEVDHNLGVIRVDTLAGKPIATVWNFAVRIEIINYD